MNETITAHRCRRVLTTAGLAVLAAVTLGLPAGNPATAATPAVHAAAPAAAPVLLKVTWQHQTEGYNCGPAATRIALSPLVRPDLLPSQHQLGIDEHTSSSTGTYRTGVAAGLNKYTPSLRWQPGTGDIWTAITGAINGKRPLPIAIEIHNASQLPPGWSGGKVGVQHWFTAIGYNPANHDVLVSDPASTGAGFNPNSAYWISLTTLQAVHVAHVSPTA